MLRTCALFLVFSFCAAAQTQPASSIQASGSATSNDIPPDQAQLTVGVVTSAKTAQDAASQDATQAAAVIAALNSVLGSSGTV